MVWSGVWKELLVGLIVLPVFGGLAGPAGQRSVLILGGRVCLRDVAEGMARAREPGVPSSD